MTQQLYTVRPHELSFTVYGLPAPQGSKRHVGRGILIDDNKETLRTWREDVKFAAMRALQVTPMWDADAKYPVIVGHFTFILPRPQSHYRTGKKAHLLKEGAPRLHGTKPDLDKLLRSTWDALASAGVYENDSRVAQVWAQKTYPTTETTDSLDRPGARIHLTGWAQ